MSPDVTIEQTSILIVDDRYENLLVLEAWLADFDLNIVKAGSGDEALERLLEQDFALVLMDVQMPGMDGFETAELMRGIERTKKVPIIFVTAASKEDIHIFKGYEAGAVDYLLKPLNPQILQSKVSVFVRLHQQSRELQKTIADLSMALGEIKTLRGILPICSHCKKIRDDKGYWNQIEGYIQKHSDAEFSHGMCPECSDELYGKEDWYIEMKKEEQQKE